MSMLTGLTTVRLVPWHRWLCYVVWLVVLITGVWWWWDQDQQMNDPAERALLLIKIHGVFAAIALLLFGSLLSTHVRVAWQRRRNRTSGALAVMLLILLGASGLGLYYADYDNREWIHTAHWWIGVVAMMLLPAHIVIGRMFRGQSARAALVGRHVRH